MVCDKDVCGRWYVWEMVCDKVVGVWHQSQPSAISATLLFKTKVDVAKYYPLPRLPGKTVDVTKYHACHAK